MRRQPDPPRPVHRARARLAAARALPSLRPGPVHRGRHLPAHLARRRAPQPAEDPARRADHGIDADFEEMLAELRLEFGLKRKRPFKACASRGATSPWPKAGGLLRPDGRVRRRRQTRPRDQIAPASDSGRCLGDMRDRSGLVRPVGFSGIEDTGGLRGMGLSEVSALASAQGELRFGVTLVGLRGPPFAPARFRSSGCPRFVPRRRRLTLNSGN